MHKPVRKSYQLFCR